MGNEQEAEAVDVRGAGGELHLVRDLLDEQLVDRGHHPMGRADGLIMLAADGRQPRVVCIESGITVAAPRLNRRFGRWVRAAARRWGVRRGRVVRVPWSKVRRVGVETELDLDAEDGEALAWEHWLLDKFVRHLPSLKPRNKKKEQNEGRSAEKNG